VCVRVCVCAFVCACDKVCVSAHYFFSLIHTHTHTHHTYTHIQVAQSAVVSPPKNAPVRLELDDDSEGVSKSVAVCSRVLQSVAVFLVSRTQ